MRHLVVGGYAVMFHTEPRFTKDLDVWVEADLENAGKLKAALQRFGGWLQHMKVEDFAEEKVMYQIGIPPVRVDFLTSVGELDFGSCWERRSLGKLGGHEAPFLGLEDLILAKEAAGREQDLLDLKKLRNAS
ncbi:MAG: hypothetical protein AAGC74_04200 [Verrucomicrobiota bacterium]